MRSSDGGASYSGGLDDLGIDERTKIERKMDQIKERLSRISLAREGNAGFFVVFFNKWPSLRNDILLAAVKMHRLHVIYKTFGNGRISKFTLNVSAKI